MKVLYLSAPAFADCDFPLIKKYSEKGIQVDYLIALAPYSLKSTLFNIKKQPQKTGILKAEDIDELKTFENFMSLDNVYIANRTSIKEYSWQSLLIAIKILVFILKGKYDIIHIDEIPRWYICLIYLFKRKIIQTIHDPFPHSGNNSWQKRFFRTLCYFFVDWFVVLNQNQYNDFCKKNKISFERVLLNRLGSYDVITAYVKHKKPNMPLNNILFFGGISQYKGVEYLCKAIVKVHDSYPNVSLTIAGGGNFNFDITHYEKLDYVDIKNRYIELDELANLIQDSIYTVCPYTDATQSGVIMTSFSLGKPVVATEVGGLPEMLGYGKYGKLCQPKNVDSLAESLLKLLVHKEAVDNYTRNITEDYYKGENSWDSIAEKYLKFYEEILYNIRK